MLSEDIEGNPNIRYGWYLRPSYAMSRAQAEMHDVLRRQFGLKVAGQFMPHATIKGFFRSDAKISDMITAFDSVVDGRKAFTVYNKGPIPHGRGGITLNINEAPDGGLNQDLLDLFTAALTAITPYVDPSCPFTNGDGGPDNFRAHLTLAMADLPDFCFDEILEFVNEANPIGPDSFIAEYFHLFAFHSEDWEGTWWPTMDWTLLHTWKLDPAEESN